MSEQSPAAEDQDAAALMDELGRQDIELDDRMDEDDRLVEQLRRYRDAPKRGMKEGAS